MKLPSGMAAFAKSARKDYVSGLHLEPGTRFYHFCKESRLVPNIEEEPGREMCAEFESTIPQWGTENQQSKLYLAPRNTFKTSIAQAFAIYLMLLFPNIRILLIRATHQDAIVVLRSIMQSLSMNAIIVEVWGNFEETALIWTETAITIGERDNREMALKEPTIDTAGIGVSKTGYHPDYVFIDDPVHENNYMSAKARAAGRLTIDALSPVLELHGVMLVTGTRWAENDLYGWIMEEDDERVKLAEKNGDADPETARLWTTYIRSAYDLGRAEAGYDVDGNPRTLFFPTRLSWAYLKRQKSKVDIKLYTAWFENRASVESTRLFRPEYFVYFEARYYAYPTPTLEFDNGLIVPLRVCMQIDPTLTAETDSDSMGVVVQGYDARDKDGNYRRWYLDAREVRMVPSEATFVIVKMLKEFVPEILLIETAAADPEMVSRITLAIRELELPTVIRSYSALRDEKGDQFERRGRIGKGQRIEALEPIHREGLTLYRRGRCAPLVSQLLKYPNTDRDDVADAAAMGRLVAGPCLQSTIIEVQDKLEDVEERLSWGPEGQPRQKRTTATNGTHVGFGAQDLRGRTKGSSIGL